ncbi:histidine triad nucleotide-binding protein [Roseibacillus ishigakijimensis]|uniref:Histidine triad nucleotide-binding protein n=1 Tax=Roseibacillus ishigakijimensis TaxID=454146 RepID=A0A934RS39_9BACT|nr:histidine triad nucleotide-binding protein [Roseibacillus ishigakijimensis]MBK1834912.1 histidine triad nucleotide-binding protein [Roseibacillus ishigakijimensis]
MSDQTLFEKIVAREIPAEIIYEDEQCCCFRDISPQAPTHLLLVPKRVIPRIAAATEGDAAILGHLFSRIPAIAAQEGFAEDGFRVVVNSGPHGGETVPHLHIHLLAGRPLQWPPG